MGPHIDTLQECVCVCVCVCVCMRACVRVCLSTCIHVLEGTPNKHYPLTTKVMNDTLVQLVML